MPCTKLVVAYDGTDYSGWQRQPDRPTVQAEIESALERLCGTPTRVTGCSRTDAGVHARGQVAAFTIDRDWPAEVFFRALNGSLPPEIAIVEAERVDDDFNPLVWARRKRYRYVIHDGPVRDVFARRYVWKVFHTLDATTMQAAAQALVGRHDFAAFRAAGCERESSVRTIFDIAVRRGGRFGEETVEVEVAGDGFLYNMVRIIVGSLYDVGRGARNAAWLGEVLAGCDRTKAGLTAPPEGLCLEHVELARPDAQELTGAVARL